MNIQIFKAAAMNMALSDAPPVEQRASQRQPNGSQRTSQSEAKRIQPELVPQNGPTDIAKTAEQIPKNPKASPNRVEPRGRHGDLEVISQGIRALESHPKETRKSKNACFPDISAQHMINTCMRTLIRKCWWKWPKVQYLEISNNRFSA